MVRITPIVAAVLLLCVPAVSDTVTVSQTVTYENNTTTNDPNGPFFIPRDVILDHDYRRGPWQDWGWTHDMSSLVPAGAIGIASATLKVRAWDVADATVSVDGVDVVYPEEDKIYAIRTSGGTQVAFKTDAYEWGNPPLYLPVTYLGELDQTGAYEFGATTFTISDAGVLADIWSNQALGVFMNIDALEALYGHQVTLIYATLTVDYVVPHATWTPDLPVYRFWSPKTGLHFYTTSESEKNKLMTQYPLSVWTYEDVAYHTYLENRQDDQGTDPIVLPVYRFWRSETGEHFFTISENEKDKLMAWCPRDVAVTSGIPSTYTYEGIAFYAHPPKVNPEDPSPPTDSLPVYRFWSPKSGEHFYTVDEAEKNKLQTQYPASVWTYEGIAWYAH